MPDGGVHMFISDSLKPNDQNGVLKLEGDILKHKSNVQYNFDGDLNNATDHGHK